LSYNYSGKNIAHCETIFFYSNSRVVRKKNSKRNKKPYPPAPLR